MKVNPFKRLFGKRRRYPIKRDIFQMTARQWAFFYFDRGLRPSEVAPEAGISTRTARRYYAHWKKLPPAHISNYKVFSELMKNNDEIRQQIIDKVANNLGMSREEVIQRLQKPWGIKQLVMGRWPNYRRQEEQRKTEVRLEAALKLVMLFEQSEMTPEQIRAWSLEI